MTASVSSVAADRFFKTSQRSGLTDLASLHMTRVDTDKNCKYFETMFLCDSKTSVSCGITGELSYSSLPSVLYSEAKRDKLREAVFDLDNPSTVQYSVVKFRSRYYLAHTDSLLNTGAYSQLAVIPNASSCFREWQFDNRVPLYLSELPSGFIGMIISMHVRSTSSYDHGHDYYSGKLFLPYLMSGIPAVYSAAAAYVQSAYLSQTNLNRAATDIISLADLAVVVSKYLDSQVFMSAEEKRFSGFLKTIAPSQERKVRNDTINCRNRSIFRRSTPTV